MTKTELKHTAQDRLLGFIAEAVYRTEEDGETEMAAEMLRQAQRVMNMFGVIRYPGLSGHQA